MADKNTPVLESVSAYLRSTHASQTKQVGNKTIQMSDAEYQEFVLTQAADFIESFYRQFRNERNALLAASDWTQTPDAPVDAKAWAKYRQELRDLPATIEDPTTTIVWPTPPT